MYLSVCSKYRMSMSTVGSRVRTAVRFFPEGAGPLWARAVTRGHAPLYVTSMVTRNHGLTTYNPLRGLGDVAQVWPQALLSHLGGYCNWLDKL